MRVVTVTVLRRLPSSTREEKQSACEFRRAEKRPFGLRPARAKRVDYCMRLKHLKALTLGTLVISGTTIEVKERSRQYVEATCTACGTIRDFLVDNLLAGKTKNCRCQRRRKYPDPRARVLGERFDAMLQRCRNPSAQSYRNYGQRGIECRFTREQFIEYMLEELPHENYVDLQIDRVNNDGHYEPGNLRLATQIENLRNRRTNKLVTYRGKCVVASELHGLLKKHHPEFDLSPGATKRLAAQGVSPEDILRRKPRRKRAKLSSSSLINGSVPPGQALSDVKAPFPIRCRVRQRSLRLAIM